MLALNRKQYCYAPFCLFIIQIGQTKIRIYNSLVCVCTQRTFFPLRQLSRHAYKIVFFRICYTNSVLIDMVMNVHDVTDNHVMIFSSWCLKIIIFFSFVQQGFGCLLSLHFVFSFSLYRRIFVYNLHALLPIRRIYNACNSILKKNLFSFSCRFAAVLIRICWDTGENIWRPNGNND